MGTRTIEVNSKVPATQIVFAGESAVTILNTDTANPIWIGDDNAILAGDLNRTVQLGFGQSVMYDGSEDKWAIANPGTVVAVARFTGGASNFFQPTTLSGLGGISVFIQPTAPTQPPTIPVNSIWLQTSGGQVTGFFTWNGTTWGQQLFNSADVLAAGTIIANLIAAGTVVAGIINGTTITGAHFVGTGNGQEFILYAGTPAANNVILSCVSAAFTDANGNAILKGTTVYFGTGPYTAISIGQVAPFITWFFGAANMNSWVQGISLNAFNSASDFQVQVTGSQIEFSFPGGLSINWETANGFVFAFVDTWHSLGALGAGSGYTVSQARYQFNTEGEIEVDIVLTAGAATVAGVYTFANSLPNGPVNNRSYDLGYNGTYQAAGTNFPSVRVTSAGAVSLQLPAFPNNTVLTANIRIPLN